MNLARRDAGIDMGRHEHRIFTDITMALFGALVPATVVDTAGKIGIALGCGFASMAGQALWRMAVRRFRRIGMP